MIGAQFVHDHVMHFYHLHALDWVDVVSALKADPKATSTLAQSISSYARSSPGYFADVQERVKKLVESGQLGIFANAYWGHPRLQAAAGSEPHGRGALSGCARLAAPGRAAAHHLRRQESAPELPGGRRPLGHQRPYAARGPAPPRSTRSACRRWPRSSSRCAASSIRSMCRTRWRSPPSTRTGSRPVTARASAIS